MGKINCLYEDTINKIAAGEVIERPASVVKELVENSIDAKADKIVVEISGGGLEKIRVADNGRGIEEDDTELAFQRHATSKIMYYRDLLMGIETLGFRGEALSSIASVSKVTLKTKTDEAEMGTLVRIEGGKVIEKKPCGIPNGTTIVCEDLFYNTPVRKTFLKSTAAETAAVTDLMSRLILANPDVSFRYVVNGSNVFMSPGDGICYEHAYNSVWQRYKASFI